jgi:DNA processing protein
MEVTTQVLNAASIRLLRPERAHSVLPEPLYVWGDISGLAAPTVAIVGTRAPSELGRRLAHSMASELGRLGVAIVSGLARGIDAAAHAGAVAVGAPSIGVLAGGHGRFYPPEHRALAEAMVRGGGAVVSPFIHDAEPFPSRFLARNGVIVALADAVVIIEAPQRSGALNTASWAAQAGVPVLVIPGDVDRPKVAGCLALIRDGATLVRNTDDVCEAIGLKMPSLRGKNSGRIKQHSLFSVATNEQAAVLDGPSQAILSALADGPRDADTLAMQTHLPITNILSLCTLLVFEQYILTLNDGSYALTPAAARNPR